ncbi:MAG: excinuclease ABC subunit UvrC [Patescibacteria group bacterium]
MNTTIPQHVQTLPQKPGTYIFKDAAGSILYIGKAIRLKSRVSSYWHRSSQLTPHKQQMVPLVKKVEYIITSSETEALLLESSLIRQHQPPYNIDLKDDKSFLYIKVAVREEFPRVFTVRRVTRDGSRYFGPYTSAGAVRQTLHLLRKLFPHRSFEQPATSYRQKYLVKRYPELMGPTDPAEYHQTIDRIIRFVRGDYQPIVSELRDRMAALSRQHQFERAAAIRDSLAAIEQLSERQKVVSPRLEDMDILSVARDRNRGAINLFTVRHGKLLGKQVFTVQNVVGQGDAETVQAFVEQYYPQATDLPREVVVPATLPNQRLLERTFKFKLSVPQRGIRRQYLLLGQENASQHLLQLRASWERDEVRAARALDDFKKLLDLPARPRRIETFDISNIQGTDAVGSMIVFTDGMPDKKWYRKFKIKTVSGSNDPAMMAEIVSRRFQHLNTPHSKFKVQGTQNRVDWPKPDLVILDGGRGQLSTVLKKIKLSVPVVALAKREEEVYLPGQATPRRFTDGSAALFLIQRMRDEAHRFAITFFRRTHSRTVRRSALDGIPGVGAATRRKLINKFGSAADIRVAGEEELGAVVGPKLAAIIKLNV